MSTNSRRILTVAVLAAAIASLYGDAQPIRAQSVGLVVTPSTGDQANFEQIAQTLVGPGVQISNVNYTGDPLALGTFSGGTGILGGNFESGIVLSSGQVADAVGPNDSDSTTTGFGTDGDSDLDVIVAPTGTFTFDAAVLEFDVTTTATQVQFKYVFTSEEYNEYANSPFNNVFAFFVGTGLTKVNCAVLPDGTPASINNINGGNPFGTEAQHPEFFINNDLQDGGGAINIQADGLTTELTCTADVIPNVPNHFKLAIADSGDSILDSWVFIKAETLSVSETVLPDVGVDGTVTEFTPSEDPQTQQFTFENLGTNETVVLRVTQDQTLENMTLKATITLHTQDELSPSLFNPAEFPPGTVCVVVPTTTTGEEVCLAVSVVDAATNEFPDPSKYLGPITWSLTVDKSLLLDNAVFGMAHFVGNSTTLPENIVLSFDGIDGTSDDYSEIVVTQSPGDSAPILVLPAELIVPADPGQSTATVTYEVSAEGVIIPTDPNFLPIYTELPQDHIVCSPPSGSAFPQGTTEVTCTATGNNIDSATGTFVSTTGSFNVTVVDTEPPLLTLPDITTEATGPLTQVYYTDAYAFDLFDGGPTPLDCNPTTGALFSVGETSVTCSSTDSSGNTSTGSFKVIITDKTAPVLTVALSRTTLWPPNHKLVQITATITVNDTVDPHPTVTLVSITSNEPDNGLGDGDTVNDIQGADVGTDDRTFFLRAESSGKGKGRIYTITYEAVDASGNLTTVIVYVRVPHDQGKK